jgi:hypothetical protein
MERAKEARKDLKSLSKGVLTLTPKDNSALPNSIATVADQNADVRGLAGKYRDPAGAIQQDKATGGWLDGSRCGPSLMTVHSVQSQCCLTGWKTSTYIGFCILILIMVFVAQAKQLQHALIVQPPQSLFCVLLPLPSPADALSSSSSEFGSSAKDAATGLKAKAKAAIKGATSAVPNSTATVADLNADVRNEASDYRDPAIATPQDKVQDKLAGERPAVGLWYEVWLEMHTCAVSQTVLCSPMCLWCAEQGRTVCLTNHALSLCSITLISSTSDSILNCAAAAEQFAGNGRQTSYTWLVLVSPQPLQAPA